MLLAKVEMAPEELLLLLSLLSLNNDPLICVAAAVPER